MSTAILVALGVLVIALALWQRLRIVRALGIEHLIATGHAFLVLGAIAGALFEPAQQQEMVRQMSPLLALAAGWVGFAGGMRFEWKVLAPVPRRAFVMALAPAVTTAIVVGGAVAGLLLGIGIDGTEAVAVAGILAAAAASSGPTLAAILRTRPAGRAPTTRPTLRMIELSAGLDTAVVVIVALVTMALARPLVDEAVPAAVILVLGAGGGVLLGLVTWLLLGGGAGDKERLLLGIGILVFTAGYGGWLLLPPAAVTAVAAMVLTNLPGQRMELLLRAVRLVERPAVVLLMLLIGFIAWGTLHWVVAPLLVIMTALRFAGKWVGARLAAGEVPNARGLATGPGWGQGLVSQGNLGLIMALSLMSVWPGPIARSALAAAAAASILNEMFAPVFLVRAVRESAEAGASGSYRAEGEG